MSVLNDPVAFRKALFGLKVDRATAALPATTSGSLFAVTGGRVLITSIVGEVTTVLGATVTNLKLRSAPTTGTAVDLCANLAVANKEAGTLFGITGTFATALVGANAGATVVPSNPVVVPIGNIQATTDATNTGSVKWSVTYVPLDDGATVTAV